MPHLKISWRQSGDNRITKKKVTQMESVKMEPATTHIESVQMEPDATEMESEKMELDHAKMENIEIEPDDRLKSHTVKRSKQEENYLKRIVDAMSETIDSPLVSTQISSKSAKQCRVRWKKGNWTKEEDKQIVELQSVHGNKWRVIASHLPGRTHIDINNRWHSSVKKSKPRIDASDNTCTPVSITANDLNLALNRGNWTKEEDKQIVELQSVHGNKWRVIVSHLPGRTHNDIRNRWHNAVRSKARFNSSNNTCAPVSNTAGYFIHNFKKRKWTKEEDKQIVELQSVNGNKWRVIASHLPGRTDNDIRNRWHSSVKKSKARIDASDNTCTPVSITAHD